MCALAVTRTVDEGSHAHVPRNEAVRKTLRPVYTLHPGWAEDISRVRRFADLPRNAAGRVLKYALREEGCTRDTWDREAVGFAIERR